MRALKTLDPLGGCSALGRSAGGTGTARKILRIAVPLLALAIVAASCGRRGPSSYNATVERDFVRGCQAVLAGGADNANDSAVSEAIRRAPMAEEHRQLCRCVYSSVSDEHSGIPFKDFAALQEAVRNQRSLASIASTAASSDDKLVRAAQRLRDTFNRCAGSAPRR